MTMVAMPLIPLRRPLLSPLTGSRPYTEAHGGAFLRRFRQSPPPHMQAAPSAICRARRRCRGAAQCETVVSGTDGGTWRRFSFPSSPCVSCVARWHGWQPAVDREQGNVATRGRRGTRQRANLCTPATRWCPPPWTACTCVAGGPAVTPPPPPPRSPPRSPHHLHHHHRHHH